MEKKILFALFAVCLLALSGCNLGWNPDEDDAGGDSSTAYYSYDWHSETNARDVYYHTSTEDAVGTLLYIEYYDLNEADQVVFVRTNYPPVSEDEEVGIIKSYAIYEWDGDLLDKAAFFNGNEECTGLITYDYDVSDRVSAVYSYLTETGHALKSGTRYQYDSDGNVSLKAIIAGEDNTATVTSGTEFAYDLSKDVLFRRSIHKLIDSDDDISDPATLNLGSVGCAVPSVSKPELDADYVCDYEGVYNSYLVSTDDETTDEVEPDVTETLLPMPETPPISDIADGDLLDQVYALSHLWDSYWFYDEALGTDVYWGVTFNADPVPVSETPAADLAGVYDTVYGLIEDQGYSDYSGWFDSFSLEIPESVHMPVQFYIDGGKGINLSADSAGDVEYTFDKPITIDLQYLPGYHLLKSKIIKYGDLEYLRIDTAYNDDKTHTVGVTLEGDAIPYPVGISLDYFNESCEGSWPESLEISVNDQPAQKFLFELDGSISDPASLEDWAILAGNQHTLWWYDGDDDLVGSFVYDYAEADGDHVLSINVKDGNDTPTGAYKLTFSPDDLAFLFGIYDKEGNAIGTYSHDFSNILSQAEDALNVWESGVDTYEDIYDQWLDGSYSPSDLLGDGMAEMPTYLISGIGDDPFAFLLNEIKALIPVELTGSAGL